MKISEVVEKLLVLKKEHGDIDVRAYQYEGCDPFLFNEDGIVFNKKGQSGSFLGGVLEENISIEGGG